MENVIIVNREIWETRVAVLENNILQDLYFDRKGQPSLEKGFIKGVIANVLPGIQTAFVDIGQAKAGFLHISEVDKDAAIEKLAQVSDISASDLVPRKKIHKSQLCISKIFKNKEQVLVQVKKEAYGTKGAKLTTSYTMPGKYLVLMPNISHIGVSSKIETKTERARLRELMDKLLPEDMGIIVRTDAENKSETDLARDLQFLLDTWEAILLKYKTAQVGESIHQDLPLVVRTIREHIDNEQVTVFCDHQDDLEAMEKFIKKFMPVNKIVLKLDTKEELFKKFNIDKQIEQLLNKKVQLACGGNIVIEHTEAMCVIDVNTSKFVGKSNQEETTLKTNLEAATEVVRQLRLRNIGGIIVIDFIDMHRQNNKQALMNCLQEELRGRDKLKSVTLNLSELGLIQMTRKRSGNSLRELMMEECYECRGEGVKKATSTLAMEILRSIKEQILLSKLQGKKIEVNLSEPMFNHISKIEYNAILSLEKTHKVKLLLIKNRKLTQGSVEFAIGK